MSKGFIGKYEVIEKIGQGGMGAIYKAKHPTLNRYIIIKQLTLTRPNVVERFKREAKIMLELRDEHIVQVYDHFKEGKFYYIAMEYIDGLSLDELIEKKRYLSNEAALLIFYEICKGVKYAHDKYVIHRDIKPANILISKNGEVKVTDFGIATTEWENDVTLTKDGATLGSPAYMPPEQIHNTKQVDKRADIYSLGVTLYKMLTGKLPYPPDISPETIALISKGKYVVPEKLNPKINKKLQAIILKCMKPKKSQRFKDVGEILKRLNPMIKKIIKVTSLEEKQNVINDLIKSYISGKEIQLVKIKLPVDKKINTIVNSLRFLFFIFLLLIIIFLYLSLSKGYFYELFNSKVIGSCKVELIIPEKLNKRNFRKIDGFIYDLEKDILKKHFFIKKRETRTPFEYFISDKLFIKTGLYRIEIDVFNNKFEHYFFVNPVYVQKKNKEKGVISIKVDNLPIYPVKIYFNFRNLNTQEELNDVEKYVLFNNEWVKWEELNEKDPFYLKSGKSYSFIFKKSGFMDKKIETFVFPHQDTLFIDVLLQPEYGRLKIICKEKYLKIMINNSNYYYDALNSRYTKIQPSFFSVLFNQLISNIIKGKLSLSEEKSESFDKEIALIPGNYTITAKISGIHESIEVNLKRNDFVRLKVVYDKQNRKIFMTKE